MACPKRWKSCLSKNLLTMLTLFGVFAGITLGFILKAVRPEGWTPREIMYIQFFGDIFLRMLKALILPLIVSSIVSAIGSLDVGLSGKIGMRSFFYFGTVTITAVILGIFLVLVIRPGVNSTGGSFFVAQEELAPTRNVTTADTLLDLLRNIFQSNLVQACTHQYRTILTKPTNVSQEIVDDINNWKIDHEYTNDTNTLGLVIFGIVLGITLGKMGDQGKPLLKFFNALLEAMMIITNWVIWLSPIGVMFLVAAKLLEIQDLSAIIGQLGLYFMTVLLGLFIHGFGTLSVIYFICTRQLPFKVIGQLGQVLATAFGTASSSATLPITLQCLDNMGNDPRITRFVVPIGSTLIMDGTALYEAIAPIFIAQVRGIDLTLSKIIGVGVMATAASIGTAGIPQASIVTMIMVLDTVGLPAKDVTLIIAVDWLLDRCRTTINVMCDALGACIIEHMSRDELDEAAARNLEEDVELAHLRKLEA